MLVLDEAVVFSRTVPVYIVSSTNCIANKRGVFSLSYFPRSAVVGDLSSGIFVLPSVINSSFKRVPA